MMYSCVCLCVCVCVVCVSRLRLMCRKQSDRLFTYKPLGVLKRSSVVRPTCGERAVRYHDNAAHLPSLWSWHLVTRSHLLIVFVLTQLADSDSDSDDGLFDRLDLAPARKKMTLERAVENGQ